MSLSPIILITGANRGLGFATVQALATKAPEAIICLGSRSMSTGNEAVQELRQAGVTSNIEVIALDVTEDRSIRSAAELLRQKYGKLDVLINNAAVAGNPKPDLSDFRDVYSTVFNTNITSVGCVTSFFMPLLSASSHPRVINVSSARASVALQTSGKLPPTASIPYSISKTGLNILTLEMAKLHENVRFYCASPGHCRTAFNNYRGKKDPADGVKVIVELAVSEHGQYEPGFWEFEGDAMSQVAW
ncbi:hypothetical protein N7468_008534 [Penicillium chermesinum]|uniref:NAD(P)-binding protein n=1 Tax=Penicillium chermesinum TaxID=63820 RepID=A0A9W9NPY0_9EURO|nr:uncharacterized protein N7468_008534 [Penicillium chermesinum]KAJ5223992.1 hypothetical protein N7468_008534 [Penicillium chermesinum]KAJ6155187.1 hypothetical protein N7470_005753 [Penicillium chermesinum]